MHNDNQIVGFKFHLQSDGLMWKPRARYTLDLLQPRAATDTNEQVSRYRAVPIGPRVIPMNIEQVLS